MPEAPDLQVVKEFLVQHVVGREVLKAEERKPLVLRNMTGAEFNGDLIGRTIDSVARKGKLLIFELSGERLLVVSPMLTGGLRLSEPSEKMLASVILTFDLDSGVQLRYFDQKKMGQVYYLEPSQREEIVRLENQGPDVLDEPMYLDEFKLGLKPFRGEVKGVLTRGQLVSGIGNAYADEILHDARIYPFKKVGRLSDDELVRLHHSVYTVTANATKLLRSIVGDSIHKKHREHLRVHGRKNEQCPRCGSKITEIRTNRKETSYCRKCQPGLLINN